MGSYTRNSKGLREVTTVMEKVAETAAASGKKRKIGLEEAANLSTTSVHQFKTRRLTVLTPVNSGHSTCESVSSDNVLASCCSSNGSIEVEKIQEEEIEVRVLELFPTSTGDSSLDCRERKEMTHLSEIQAESGQLESTTTPHESISRRRLMTEKMPSEVELEEFFAAAEKNLQKKFFDKYNYDIVKDEPLEGRYEWYKFN